MAATIFASTFASVTAPRRRTRVSSMTLRRLAWRPGASASTSSAFALTLMAVAWWPASATTTTGPVFPALEEASLSQTHYRRGDEVVLKLHVGAGTASVKADFSAVDSHFRRAAVAVEAIRENRWIVRYRLSQGNTRNAGTYRVLVQLVPASGDRPVTRSLSLDYLPNGPGEMILARGTFVVAQMPRREIQRGLSVTVDLQQSGRAEVKRGVDPTAPVELVLTVDSERRLHADALKFELAEVKADGFWRMAVRLTNERCTSRGCRYLARTIVEFAPAGRRSSRTPAGIGQLVSAAGSASVLHVPSLPKAALPFEHTHRVTGTISFQYRAQHPDPMFSPNSDMYPWKALRDEITSIKPIRSGFLRLEDQCGHNIEGSTNAVGEFVFEWTPVNCGTGTITVSTVSPSQRAGVGRWLHGTITDPDELTGESEDYRAHSWAFEFDTDAAALATGGLDVGTRTIVKDEPAARAFNVLDNVMTARSYYDTLPGVNMTFEAPTINVVYSPGLKPEDVVCDSDWDPSGYLYTAFYAPSKHEGFIYVPAEIGCDYAWDAHAVIHETSHLFQRHFLRADPDYGRFGEGLANVQAAVVRGTRWITGGAGQLESLDVNSRMACWLDGAWDHDLIVDNSIGKTACTDAGGVPGFPVASVWDASTASAGWFQRVVWDLVDGDLDDEPLTIFVPAGMSPDECGPGTCNAGDFDPIDGGGGDGVVLPSSAALNDVLIYYLGGNGALGTNPHYEDRGLDGLDLVDLLDGMVCRGHATAAEVQTLYGAMGFDYDGLGPASCPHPDD